MSGCVHGRLYPLIFNQALNCHVLTACIKCLLVLYLLTVQHAFFMVLNAEGQQLKMSNWIHKLREKIEKSILRIIVNPWKKTFHLKTTTCYRVKWLTVYFIVCWDNKKYYFEDKMINFLIGFIVLPTKRWKSLFCVAFSPLLSLATQGHRTKVTKYQFPATLMLSL